MTDTTNREMLELAAKAAGYSFKWGKDWHDKGAPLVDDKLWNPLTDDGDAFQLAARLKLQVAFGTFKDNTASAYQFGKPAVEVENTDMEAAAREAIFLMAVEIGKGMN